MVDRIERHDIVNAVMLAAVLLLLGFGIVSALGGLFDTMDDGFVISSKEPEPPASDASASATATSGTEVPGSDPPAPEAEARPAGEVNVRVGNGARRPGVAGAGTEALADAGYSMLPPRNGPTVTDSIVYHLEGYAPDAARIAELLDVDPERVEPMPDDPGVAIDDAHVIVLLGVSSDL